MNTAQALEAEGIRKVYGGEVALADARLRVGQGTIHGLLGANGAGKSTLVKIVCGVEPQDAGTVRIGGAELPAPHTAQAATDAGIAYIHQDRALIPDLTIAENIALTLGYPRRNGLVSFAEMRRRAERALATIRLEHDVETLVRDLPIADQTMVAIARALATDARVILLDEPTANLSAAESAWLYARLRELSASGVSCLLITHALAEALDVCDEVTVLRDGVTVATHPAAELDERRLTELMIGHRGGAPAGHAHRRGDVAGEPRLRLDDAVYDVLGPISLELRAGEIVAVTGLVDSGHLLLGELLSGLAPAAGGAMELDGQAYAPRSVGAARAHGVAYVPPDRLRDGLAADMSVRENLFLTGSRFRSALGIRRGEERRSATELLAESRVTPADPEAVLSTLSGGNMQKVLVTKWLADDPSVLVLAEPTVGVDVGARDEIYERLRTARDEGLSILLTSSDFEEVLTLADRVLVLRYGTVVGESAAAEISIDQLSALSSGADRGGTQ